MRLWRQTGAWVAVRRTAAVAATAAAVIYLVFLGTWGLNYRREPLTARLDFERGRVTRESVARLGRQVAARLNALHAEVHARGWPAWEELPRVLAPSFDAVQRQLAPVTPARPGVPKWSLLTFYFERAGVSGVTDPFALEVVVDRGQLPFERPFVAAHEWAHLAGYADESEANFIGWLVCFQGPPPAEYSGDLALLMYVLGSMPAEDRTAVTRLLGPGPRKDLEEIGRRAERVWPWLQRPAWWVYDRYLRANRVERGRAELRPRPAAHHRNEVRGFMGPRRKETRMTTLPRACRRHLRHGRRAPRFGTDPFQCDPRDPGAPRRGVRAGSRRELLRPHRSRSVSGAEGPLRARGGRGGACGGVDRQGRGTAGRPAGSARRRAVGARHPAAIGPEAGPRFVLGARGHRGDASRAGRGGVLRVHRVGTRRRSRQAGSGHLPRGRAAARAARRPSAWSWKTRTTGSAPPWRRESGASQSPACRQRGRTSRRRRCASAACRNCRATSGFGRNRQDRALAFLDGLLQDGIDAPDAPACARVAPQRRSRRCRIALRREAGGRVGLLHQARNGFRRPGDRRVRLSGGSERPGSRWRLRVAVGVGPDSMPPLPSPCCCQSRPRRRLPAGVSTPCPHRSIPVLLGCPAPDSAADPSLPVTH